MSRKLASWVKLWRGDLGGWEPISQPQTPKALSIRGHDAESNEDRKGGQAGEAEEPETGESVGPLERTGLETVPER